MKANELMIGDWVYDKMLKGYGKIEVLTPYVIKCDIHTDTHHMDFFEPIPLTEEILKANGWQKNDPHWVSTLRRYCDKDGSEWSLSFTLQKGIWDAYIHNGGDLNINKFHPMYVHELQHALRICGLTDLADNFKIS